MKQKGKFVASLLFALCIAGAGSAQAGMITYDTWATNENGTGNYIFTVDDEVSGKFNYSLTVHPWNAEAFGVFIDFGSKATGGGALNLAGDSSVSLEGRDTTDSVCGPPSCNISGLSIPGFDGTWGLIFGLGTQGFNGIQTFSWSTTDFGLSLSDFGVVAIRAQQLCADGSLLPDNENSCGGSDKAYGYSTVSVPEPGTLALLGLGLIGLWVRRKKVEA
ncbi:MULTISPECIES: PEP-CTERM sorting domain-containing protein [Marinobacter]|jgi:hypothetical protein|uniref:Ice-binding protein C-terminal domain-containing protein n=1 Tax=Marinobacter manganoxydans MnI7-9 TaxID=1094979 RepID=G6YN39_9GAMM|nr:MULTISPECIES: PEP-CTERM sorting domain-containing protein [Marinobacter]EHJ06368.1 hypothetical protein KYE_01201 [Marinobacter manganoxydans MnI7-9]MAK50702.1 PEP-CTERM sorting domain-containing protein [Marinobacter sp.]|tara:strand:- start:4378 stop:5034 length:657 start_codon:yes stop_codon:yes gene_type:complete